MNSLCISTYPDSIMDTQYLTRDEDLASNMSSSGSTYYPGLSEASYPSLRAHSGTSFLQFEGSQNFPGPLTSRAQNGYNNSFHFSAMSPISQNGPIRGSRTQMYAMPHHANQDVDQWISAVELPMESPTVRTTIPEYQDLGAVEMSYSLSGTTLLSDSPLSDHSSPSDITVYKNSPQNETECQIDSKYQNGCANGQNLQRSQSNGNARPHALHLTIDSTLNLPGYAGEDALFTSTGDMHGQPYYQNGVSTSQGLQIGNQSFSAPAWDVDQDSRAPSPVFHNGLWTAPYMHSPPESHHDFYLNGAESSTQYARIQGKSVDQNMNRSYDEFGSFSSNSFSYDTYGDEQYPAEDSQQARRASADADSSGAREHHLYRNAQTGPDGLYHCPWEGKTESCNHKPEKLKCNYDKFVDSHLKPYRCKIQTCENARFSSTACLLRHEREAHAMHGHGEKPFLCTFSGCERGMPGHGFPRHWNLRDHMRRVHDTEPSAVSSNKPAKMARKRKSDNQDSGANKRTPTSTSEPAQVVRLSPKEQLQFRRRQMQEVLNQMDDADPEDPTTRDRVRTAENAIKEMHHIVRAVPKMVHSRRTSHISG